MELTIKELVSHLAQRSEEQVVELLNLTSQDILERFEDIVEERYEYLMRELELLNEEENDEI
jgi:hypothetical protein